VQVGKKSFPKEHLVANAMALLEAIVKASRRRPRVYLRTVTLSTTMGPGIPVDAQRVANQFKKQV
jgi:large subunit ribosomal protein L1